MDGISEGIIPPSVRRLREMRGLLCDARFAARADSQTPLYYMHRAIARRGPLRYDITVIPPLMLGPEYNKTAGHYHSLARRGLSYPEVYEVLHGSATYLLQMKRRGKGARKDELVDAMLIEAEAGDKLLVPPNYGHVTINRSKPPTTLIMANIVSDRCESDYSDYERLHGACYYLTKKGAIKNPNYGKVPELRKQRASSPLPPSLSLYGLLANNSRSLKFLDDPQLL
ncbi:Glucose-6-phosphate isomerase [Candidatus Burarchaeum australiense]|nr:Glucose-6-phosphate isomerase [Candidatus Burarchaeum australiense]